MHSPSVFRVYIGMTFAADAQVIGHLSERDWDEVRARLRVALAVST
jgi:hypothetical protein